MIGAATRERTGPRRLLPTGLVRPALRTAVGAAVLLVVLGGIFWHGTAPSAPDRAIARPLIGYDSQGHDLTVLRLADLGSPVPVFLLTFCVAVLALARRRLRALALLALALPLASGLTEWVLKPLVHRTKDGVLAFPSGHATGVFTLALVTVVVLLGPRSSTVGAAARVATGVGAVFLAVVVSAALVASDFHYASDTLGGACVAVGCVVSVALGLDALAARRTGTAED
jgi:membrane-associated phospholipid phosphatase